MVLPDLVLHQEVVVAQHQNLKYNFPQHHLYVLLVVEKVELITLVQ